MNIQQRERQQSFSNGIDVMDTTKTEIDNHYNMISPHTLFSLFDAHALSKSSSSISKPQVKRRKSSSSQRKKSKSLSSQFKKAKSLPLLSSSSQFSSTSSSLPSFDAFMSSRRKMFYRSPKNRHAEFLLMYSLALGVPLSIVEEKYDTSFYPIIVEDNDLNEPYSRSKIPSSRRRRSTLPLKNYYSNKNQFQKHNLNATTTVRKLATLIPTDCESKEIKQRKISQKNQKIMKADDTETTTAKLAKFGKRRKERRQKKQQQHLIETSPYPIAIEMNLEAIYLKDGVEDKTTTDKPVVTFSFPMCRNNLIDTNTKTVSNDTTSTSFEASRTSKDSKLSKSAKSLLSENVRRPSTSSTVSMESFRSTSLPSTDDSSSISSSSLNEKDNYCDNTKEKLRRKEQNIINIQTAIDICQQRKRNRKNEKKQETTKVTKLSPEQKRQVRFLSITGSNKGLPSIFEGLEQQESFR